MVHPSCIRSMALSCSYRLLRGSWRGDYKQLSSPPTVREYIHNRAQQAVTLSQIASPCWLSSASTARVKQHAFDRDVIMSVLQASATRRDAKIYLQKYASKKQVSVRPFRLNDHPTTQAAHVDVQEPIHVAIMTLRAPQNVSHDILLGIAKTLTQLRTLGLLSVVILDCGIDEDRSTFTKEAVRLCEAIDSFGKPGTRLVENILERGHQVQQDFPSLFWDDIRVEDKGLLARTLQRNMIPVIPSVTCEDATTTPLPTDGHKAVLSLTKFLTGMQFEESSQGPLSPHDSAKRHGKIASVERIIILDTSGGIPVPGIPMACQRFVNIEQEYNVLLDHLEAKASRPVGDSPSYGLFNSHAANLRLARDALSLLPATSSALITTPFAASNANASTQPESQSALESSRFSFDGMVITRKKHNPLLHNLLTDKPVFSSSLPLQRVQGGEAGDLKAREATLVKRGMPLTIYPDPRRGCWCPPRLKSPQLRLTDHCIDLPRLVNLIEDSFGRKLDVDAYLKRMNEKLAGVIIAGEYEGCAILTWEQPDGIDHQAAYTNGRFVPYLDKFAVLRSCQGSGGVADIIFNAIVRDCFPGGFCWRSRKDNPVNKWYFERSMGTSQLSNCNWAMFWTTIDLHGQDGTLEDYESVCRSIVHSWSGVENNVDYGVDVIK